MNRFGRVVFAAVVIGSLGSCTRDPLSDLARGPRVLVLSRSRLATTAGAEVGVVATLRDARGAFVPIERATWRSGDTAVADVVGDTVGVQGGYEAHATVLARGLGGATTITVAAGGATATMPIAVLPTHLDSALVSYAGTPRADTAAAPFTAPDTLILSGTASLHFDTTSASGVYRPVYVRTAAGRVNGYVVSRSPTRLKVVFVRGVAGPLVVRQLLMATGDSSFGTVRLDSLAFDSVAVSRQYFNGSIAVVGDTITVTAGTGTTIARPTSYATPSLSFGDVAGAVMSQSSTQLRALTSSSYTGVVTIRGVVVTRSDGSSATLDSVKTSRAYTIPNATFPGPMVTRGRLLDPVTVYAADGATLAYGSVWVPATYLCTACMFNAWITFSSPDSMRFIVPVGVAGRIYFSDVRVGNAFLPMLSRASLTVSGDSTGEPNEPANDSATGATVLDGQVFGALNGSTDTTDYYTFQVPAPALVSLSTFIYPGSYGPVHMDAYVCDSLAGGVCAGEVGLLSGPVLLPAGTAWLRIALRTPQQGAVAYDLVLNVVPVSSVRASQGRR